MAKQAIIIIKIGQMKSLISVGWMSVGENSEHQVVGGGGSDGSVWGDGCSSLRGGPQAQSLPDSHLRSGHCK